MRQLKEREKSIRRKQPRGIYSRVTMQLRSTSGLRAKQLRSAQQSSDKEQLRSIQQLRSKQQPRGKRNKTLLHHKVKLRVVKKRVRKESIVKTILSFLVLYNQTQAMRFDIPRVRPRYTMKFDQQRMDLRAEALRGATRQMATEDDPPIAATIENSLESFGITGPLALSISSTFASIIFAIIGAYQNRYGKRLKWIVISIISSFTSLMAQLFVMSKCSIPPGFTEFCKESITSMFSAVAEDPTQETVQQQYETITSRNGWLEWVTLHAQSLDEITQAWEYLEQNRPLLVVNLPKFPIYDDSMPAIARQQYMVKTSSSFLYYPQEVILRINKAEHMKNILKAELIRMKTSLGKVKTPQTSHSDNSDTEPEPEPTPVQKPTPKVRTKILQGASKHKAGNPMQSLMVVFRDMFGLLASAGVCIAMYVSGKQVDFATMSRNWQGVDMMTDKFSATMEKIGMKTAKQEEKNEAQKLVISHVTALNELMAISPSTYASHVGSRNLLKTKLKEVEEFLKVPMDPKVADKFLLQGLYAAANKFRNDIEQASKEQVTRQEPRLVLFYGEGSVGKTKTCEKLACDIGREHFADLDPGRRQISITPAGKYFPRLGGEPQWIVDEVGGKRDFREDLIFSNLRGLCSSARFGADTAEIGGKDQGAECKIIYGATNTEPDTILARISDMDGPESVEPCSSRIMLFKCIRNVKKYGNLNPNERDTQSFDTTGRMRHILYIPMKFNRNTKKYEEEPTCITYEQLKGIISNKISVLAAAHHAMLTSLEGAEQQTQSKAHFVINQHGPPLSGKGRAADQLIPYLKNITRYPVIYYTSKDLQVDPIKLKERVIAVVDDLIPVDYNARNNAELWYMNLYNNALVNGSIIVFNTNIIPATALPRISITPQEKYGIPVPRVTIKERYELKFHEPGVLRRMGWRGDFISGSSHEHGVCLYVKKDKYTVVSPRSVNISSFWILLALLTSYFTLIPTVCVVMYIIVAMLLQQQEAFALPKINEYVFGEYRKFIKSVKDIEIHEGAVTQTEAKIHIKAADLTAIARTATTQIANHVFTNRLNFMASQLSWKVWLHDSIVPKLMSQTERFLAFVPDRTVESIIHFSKILNEMFCLTGAEIDVLVETDLGKFYLNNGHLQMDLNENGIKVTPTIILMEKHLAMTPSTATDDTHNVYITWEAVAKYILYNETLPDIEHMSKSQVDMVIVGICSPIVMGSRHLREAKARIQDERDKLAVLKLSKEVKDAVTNFLNTTTGKIIAGLAAALTVLMVTYGIYKVCKNDDVPRKDRKSRQRKSLSSTDSDSEDEMVKHRKKPRSDRQAPDVTDRDVRRRRQVVEEQRKRSKQPRDQEPVDYTSDRGNRRKRHTVERQALIPQSVSDLPDMNGYSEFKNMIGELHDKVSGNEAWVVMLPDQGDVIECQDKATRDGIISSGGRCYGLFIRGTDLITVGHLLEISGKHLYVSSDEFGNKIYKMTLVKDMRSANRDISLWTLRGNPHGSKCKQYKDISGKFVKTLAEFPEASDVIVKRYAASKQKEFLYGTMYYEPDTLKAVDANGHPYSLAHWGVTLFSFSTLALMTYGDCGLPYYNIVETEKLTKQVKLSGIHCMGNTRDSISAGITAIITQADFKHFSEFTPQAEQEELKNTCKWCEANAFVEQDPLPEKKASETHKIIWHPSHLASSKSMIDELKWLFNQGPFEGYIRKGVGEKAGGSVEHSHLHHEMGYHAKMPAEHDWKQHKNLQGFGPCLEKVFKIQNIRTLDKWFKDNVWINQFWVGMQFTAPFKSRNGKQQSGHFMVDIIVLDHDLDEEQLKQLLKAPLRRQMIPQDEDHYLLGDETVFCPKQVADLIVETQDYDDYDIPIQNCQTVSEIGALKYSVSRTPNLDFVRLEGSYGTKFPVEKKPFNVDTIEAPEEQWEQMTINKDGICCPRATQSVQWQGKEKSLPIEQQHDIMREYKTGMTQYNGCRELTDREMFYGSEKELLGGLARLELNRSIGFSLSALFPVTLKEHVISLSQDGRYAWMSNGAALFAQEWLMKAKNAVRSGVRPLTCYIELLKMEKLKVSKNFLGRIFCAADLIAVLLQRKFLGAFVAISTLRDPVVGVGFNPWADFHQMARELRAKGHYFTGDYKRWDKTVPRVLFEMMGKMLDSLNPENKTHQLLFSEVWNSLHVSGRTVFQKHRGMPSGAVVTANLNSKINDLAIYTCYYRMATRRMKDTSYEAFNLHVYRKFYGDDVILGVDDETISWFNMETLRRELMDTLGFVLDSSEKDGIITREMYWEELSWCSRYFRKLVNYDFYVGALKKSTITSLLQWRRKSSDTAIVAAQLNVALLEASLWEREFYDKVCEEVKNLIKHNKYLAKYVSILPYEHVQGEIYSEGIRTIIIRHTWNQINEMWDDEDGWYIDPTDSSKFELEQRSRTYSNQICSFAQQQMQNLHILTQQAITDNTEMSYVSMLNIMAQSGSISMPEYDYEETEYDKMARWKSTVKTINLSAMKPQSATGHAPTKAGAKEAAAKQLVAKLQHKELIHKMTTGMTKQMNVSGGDQIPIVASTGRDMSLTAGSMVFSNTQFAQGSTNLNPVGFSVNNIAQTGAPFDLKDSVYHIMQLEKQTAVSGVQAVGSEVFRISLDPQARPELHKQYIQAHEDHVPSVDFGIYIGGTAGAIGTLKIGFVKDISLASYTLDQIQSIASQDVAMGQSSTVSFRINDIRRTGLYRKVDNDPEPYPGIVALVSNPITNVQRNDTVQYPIQVYSRLAPDYLLASPRSVATNTVLTEISLSSYFTISTFDLAVNNTQIVSESEDTIEYPDCGFTTGAFEPRFNNDNLYAYSSMHYTFDRASAYYSHNINEEVYVRDLEHVGTGPMLYELYFGFGTLPTRDDAFVGNNDTTLSAGTQWAIQPFTVKIGDLQGTCNRAYIFEGGVVLRVEFDVKQTTVGETKFLGTKISKTNYTVPYSKTHAMTNDSKNGYINLSTSTTSVGAKINAWKHYAGNGPKLEIGLVSVNDLETTLKDWTEDAVVSRNNLYVWTWLAMSNQLPTYAAPTGFARLMFVRPGTSLSSDLTVAGPYVPGYERLCNTLEAFRIAKKAEWITGYFGQNATASDFQFAYRNGIFLVRTPESNLIKLSLSSYSVLTDLRPSNGPTEIVNFPTSTFRNWVTSSGKNIAKLYMQGAAKQAALGFGAASGLFGGLWEGYQYANNMDNYNTNMELNRKLQLQLQNLRNEGQLALSKQNFEQGLSMKGFSSASAQAGNLQRGVGTNTDSDETNTIQSSEAANKGDNKVQAIGTNEKPMLTNGPILRDGYDNKPRQAVMGNVQEENAMRVARRYPYSQVQRPIITQPETTSEEEVDSSVEDPVLPDVAAGYRRRAPSSTGSSSGLEIASATSSGASSPRSSTSGSDSSSLGDYPIRAYDEYIDRQRQNNGTIKSFSSFLNGTTNKPPAFAQRNSVNVQNIVPTTTAQVHWNPDAPEFHPRGLNPTAAEFVPGSASIPGGTPRE